MDYWLNVGLIDPHQLVPIARAAERLGFTGVTLPDHLCFPESFASAYPYSDDGTVSWPAETDWPDPWVAIAAMAQATDRLRFSTSVYVAPLREPFHLAKAISTAAVLSGGRVSCGLGAGWLREEFDAVGMPFEPRGSRLDEIIDVMRLLWTGEMVSHHGDHFSFDPVQMRPAAPHMRVLIGGNTAPALARAARNDGWIGTYTTTEQVLDMITVIGRRRADLGRLDGEFELMVVGSPRMTRDMAQLEAAGVRGLILSVAALGAGTDLTSRLESLERFAERVEIKDLEGRRVTGITHGRI
jgi:probable F420-dependent oxidoreductase